MKESLNLNMECKNIYVLIVFIIDVRGIFIIGSINICVRQKVISLDFSNAKNISYQCLKNVNKNLKNM